MNGINGYVSLISTNNYTGGETAGSVARSGSYFNSTTANLNAETAGTVAANSYSATCSMGSSSCGSSFSALA